MLIKKDLCILFLQSNQASEPQDIDNELYDLFEMYLAPSSYCTNLYIILK